MAKSPGPFMGILFLVALFLRLTEFDTQDFSFLSEFSKATFSYAGGVVHYGLNGVFLRRQGTPWDVDAQNELDDLFELDDEYSLHLVDDYIRNLRRTDPRGDNVHTLGLRPDQYVRLYTLIDAAIIREDYDRAVRSDFVRALRFVRDAELQDEIVRTHAHQFHKQDPLDYVHLAPSIIVMASRANETASNAETPTPVRGKAARGKLADASAGRRRSPRFDKSIRKGRKHRASSSGKRTTTDDKTNGKKKNKRTTAPSTSSRKRRRRNNSLKTNLAATMREDEEQERRRTALLMRDPESLVDTHILLTGEIYKLGVPEEYKGHLFRYVVSKYHSSTKLFDLTYDAQTVKEDGVSFLKDDESPTETLEGVALESVQRGVELYRNAKNRVHTHEKTRREVIKKSLQPNQDNVMFPCEVDVSDIDDAAIDLGWTSVELMEVRVVFLHWIHCSNVMASYLCCVSSVSA